MKHATSQQQHSGPISDLSTQEAPPPTNRASSDELGYSITE
jgi:hypothetical protein